MQVLLFLHRLYFFVILNIRNKKTYKMKKIIFLFIISSLISIKGIGLTLSPETEVSILTCAPGNELYSLFGHTAIRINDPRHQIDRVYNYGTFDFSTPHFYLKYARGLLPYQLTVQKFSHFIYNYQLEERTVYAQTIRLDSLEKQLQKCEPDKVKLIVIDGVFSMEGDIAKLPEIVALAKKYNASIMVDEAHGLGVLGDHGRGTCNHFGVTDDVDLIMGTFSKSLASIGGFIASDKETINYLRHNSRSYIFSASNTPAATAAAGAALDIMLSEPERIEHLWKLTHYALDGFRNMGCEIGHTSTPIIPLFIRNNDLTFLIVKELFEAGIFVNPVVSPAVAPEDTLIRFSLMATHTIEQLDYALEAIHKVFKSHGLVK